MKPESDGLKLFLVAAETTEAAAAITAIEALYPTVADPKEADVIVALGGDGTMLHALHLAMHAHLPVYGMNLGTLGFLLNPYAPEKVMENLVRAQAVKIHPLVMQATLQDGSIQTAHAINEVSLLRETRQTAKIKVTIDKRLRMDELICDGVLVSTAVGSTAYNLSAHGPILPLTANVLALTPISAFRPRRWRGAVLPNTANVNFEILDPAKRPVSAVADFTEIRDVASVHIKTDPSITLTLLFNPETHLAEKILQEQFAV